MTESLLGRDISELGEIVAGLGEPSYRARQIYAGIYGQRATDWEQITALPAAVRRILSRDYSLQRPRIAEQSVSVDGTVKYLLRLEDGKTVEAVFLPEEYRDTLCISTQAGCAVDCKFCLTALLGLERNLTAGEIAGQVLTLLAQHGLSPQNRQLNVVMMGMGEPLLNLESVLKATGLLSDASGIGISPRRVTVSTSGLIPQMKVLGAQARRPRLAVSLNASTEESRREIMPITRKYALADLLAACKSYPLRSWERLTFEYVVLGEVNDSEEDARRVVGLLSPLRCKVNLIPFNPGGGLPFQPPSPNRVKRFQEIVRRSIPCFVRRPRGQDIYAACGQLKRTTRASVTTSPHGRATGESAAAGAF